MEQEKEAVDGDEVDEENERKVKEIEGEERK